MVTLNFSQMKNRFQRTKKYKQNINDNQQKDKKTQLEFFQSSYFCKIESALLNEHLPEESVWSSKSKIKGNEY